MTISLNIWREKRLQSKIELGLTNPIFYQIHINRIDTEAVHSNAVDSIAVHSIAVNSIAVSSYKEYYNLV